MWVVVKVVVVVERCCRWTGGIREKDRERRERLKKRGRKKTLVFLPCLGRLASGRKLLPRKHG